MEETELTEQEAIALPDETEAKPEDAESHDPDDIESLTGEEVPDDLDEDLEEN